LTLYDLNAPFAPPPSTLSIDMPRERVRERARSGDAAAAPPVAAEDVVPDSVALLVPLDSRCGALRLRDGEALRFAKSFDAPRGRCPAADAARALPFAPAAAAVALLGSGIEFANV